MVGIWVIFMIGILDEWRSRDGRYVIWLIPENRGADGRSLEWSPVFSQSGRIDGDGQVSQIPSEIYFLLKHF